MKCIDSPCLLALRLPAQRVDLRRFAAGTLPSDHERADPIADTELFRPRETPVMCEPARSDGSPAAHTTRLTSRPLT